MLLDPIAKPSKRPLSTVADIFLLKASITTTKVKVITDPLALNLEYY
jgi:hypothetical protein